MSSLKSFRSDERGGVAALSAFSFIAVLGLAGGALDYSRAVEGRTALQKAVDAAALGAANAELPQDSDRVALARSIFSANNRLGSSVAATVSAPSGNTTVTVSATAQISTSVLAALGFKSLAVASTATAMRMNDGAPICVLALSKTASGAITFSGNTSFAADGCAVQSNAKHAQGLAINGSAQVLAKSFCSAGGVSNGQQATPAARGSCPVVGDPFVAISYPATGGCTWNNVQVQPGEHAVLNPGTYCGGLNLKGNVTLSPGMYIVKNGQLSISSQAAVSGQAVTFFLTGNNAGFTINGGGAINIRSPADGQYAGMLIIQDKGANPGSDNTLTGSSNTGLIGAIYTPAHGLTVTGNSFGQPNPFMPLVADTIKFSGSSVLRADTTNTKVAQPLPRIGGNTRLVQ